MASIITMAIQTCPLDLLPKSKAVHFQRHRRCGPYLPQTSSSSISCSKSSSDPSLLSPLTRRPPYIPAHIPDPSYVRILDTTLRDGEQAPGAAMNSKQKLEIARQLAKLGVDIMDAGFPPSSKEDFEAVKCIAQEIGNEVDSDGHVPVIAASCRCTEEDIRSTWEAVRHARRPRIQTFIATSDIHLKYKLNKTKDQVTEIARNMVKFARSLGCYDIGFCAEDAAR